jgi:hypothetical protein
VNALRDTVVEGDLRSDSRHCATPAVTGDRRWDSRHCATPAVTGDRRWDSRHCSTPAVTGDRRWDSGSCATPAKTGDLRSDSRHCATPGVALYVERVVPTATVRGGRGERIGTALAYDQQVLYQVSQWTRKILHSQMRAARRPEWSLPSSGPTGPSHHRRPRGERRSSVPPLGVGREDYMND